jgi:putative FmdB family regulatory protein
MLKPRTQRPRIQTLQFQKMWKAPMPHYEFFCRDCKKFFDKILSLVDYEEDEVQCSHCGSKNVEQRWSAFSAITSKKSA